MPGEGTRDHKIVARAQQVGLVERELRTKAWPTASERFGRDIHNGGAFKEGQPIPAEYSCDGAGRIPPLAWQGAPAEAPVALVVDDPDAPSGTFTHWVVLDLPSGTAELSGASLPSGAVEATNCPGAHHSTRP